MKNRRGMIFTGIGFELVAIILIAIFLGSFLEEKYPKNGMWQVGLIIVGFFIWIVHIILLVKVMEKNDKKE